MLKDLNDLPVDPVELDYAQCLLKYNLLGQPLGPAECIIALGCYDLRVADRAAQLYLQGYAPLLLCSGYFGANTRGVFVKTEAETFADRARQSGVPEKALLLEMCAVNTGQNVQFSKELLSQHGLSPKRVIAVQKPYMERRTLATFNKVWPEVEVLVTSPPLSFEELPPPGLTQREVIEIIVGDTHRVIEYPKLGFQTPQEMPLEVSNAFEQLVKRGYTARMIKNSSIDNR